MWLDQNLAFNMHGKIKNTYNYKKQQQQQQKLKYRLQHGMKILNCLMNHILYHIFNINLTLSSKKHETVPGNPSIKTYVNKTGIICNNNI